MEAQNQFISSEQAKAVSRSEYYKILQKADNGELVRIKRGVYAKEEQLADVMIDVEGIIPQGILCLWSAWNIHQLTTSLPQAYHVAVKRGRKVVLPEYPLIELHHVSDDLLDLGAEYMDVSNYHVRIYNLERSTCDAIKFRNKVGIEVCSEVINNYLSLRQRNIPKLMDYARKLRVANIMEKYLEVKL